MKNTLHTARILDVDMKLLRNHRKNYVDVTVDIICSLVDLLNILLIIYRHL